MKEKTVIEAAPVATPRADSRPSERDHSMAALRRYQNPSLFRSLFQLATTIVPFSLCWYAAYRSLEVSYGLTLLFALPAAVLLIRLFIFQHDCGHGSFFKSQALNNAVGSIIGVLSFTPYQYWRRTHAIHHANSGNIDAREFGEVTTLTVAEYQALTPKKQRLYRLYRHPIVLFVIGPAYQFIFKHRMPFDMPRTWRREWMSVIGTNLGLVGLTLLGSSMIGFSALWKVQLPVILMAGSLGVWLFYIQHQYEAAYWKREAEWNHKESSLQGSSFYDLPPVLNWLTGNIGVHHIHHLCSRIPNYRLHECLREQPSLQAAQRLTIRQSLACVRFKLWDEANQKMVGFKNLGRTLSGLGAS